MNYELVPAVFICCLCKQPVEGLPSIELRIELPIEGINQPVPISELVIELENNGIEVQKFAHSKCAGLAEKS